MTTAMLRSTRARSAEEKRLRRDDILRAVERLWADTPYADLSMSQVANEVRLAKGTLYLYFQTKEELFLALLTEHYQHWLAHLSVLLTERRPSAPGEVADVITQSLRGFSAMRRLQSLLGGVLDRSELAEGFRRQVQAMMQVAARDLPYSQDTAMRVLAHTDALCVGWQQLSGPLAADPALFPAELDSEQEINSSLRALLLYLAD